MADESEKKTGVVLNKHVQDSHPAGEASPKRKIVIKRKAPSVEAAKQEQKKRIHVVSNQTPD